MPSIETLGVQVGATVTAVGIGAAIADTGALTAGDYRVIANLGSDGVGAAGKAIVLEHRDSTNATTIRTLARCPFGVAQHLRIDRVTIATNERIRAIGGSVAGGAGENSTAYIEVIAVPV